MQTHVTFQDYSGSVDPPEDESGSETPNGKLSRNLVRANLPNAELLRLHAALARVMHLSGAGEMFPERVIPTRLVAAWLVTMGRTLLRRWWMRGSRICGIRSLGYLQGSR